VFDCPFFKVIDDLIACKAARTTNSPDLFQIRYIEIAYAPTANHSLEYKLFKRGDSPLELMRTAPVQKVTVQVIGAETRETRILTNALMPSRLWG